MKKSFMWGGVVFLAVLVFFLVLIKISWQNNPEKANTDLGAVAKAESFEPTSMPTILAKEKISGSLKAPVKILVYEDYSSVFSADNAEVLKKIQDEFGNKILLVVRPFVSREKPNSIESAMAVECASQEGKWSEMRNGIFQVVKLNMLNSSKIKNIANQIGLDEAKFAKCLTSAEKQGIMLQTTEAAKQFSVYGAPTSFINNELIVGARPYDDYMDENGVKIEGLKSLVERQIQ